MINEKRYWQWVSCLGACSLAVAIAVYGLGSSQSIDKIIIFGLLLLISKLQNIHMNTSYLTTDFGFVVSGVAILGPVYAATIIAVTTILTQLYIHRLDRTSHKYWRALFNASQYVLSVFFGMGVYNLFAHKVMVLPGIPLLMGILVYFVANNFFVEISLYLHGKQIKGDWMRSILADAQTYILSVPLGLLTIYIYRTEGFYWSMAVLFIYLMGFYIFVLYMNLKEKNRELSALVSSATIMASSLDYEEVLEKVMASVESLMFWDTICIYIYQKNALIPAKYEGFDEDFKVMRILPGTLLGGCKIFDKEAVIVNNCNEAREFSKFSGFPKNTKTMMAIPLFINHELIGGITITSSQPGAYNRRHLDLMTILSNQAAVAISNAKRYSSTTELAITDGLTKLYNYRYIRDELHNQIERSEYNKESLSIILIDIDRFKRYNDAYGHIVGDTILVNLSEVMKNSVRDEDIIGRYGGEEFCIILPRTSSQKAVAIAERIRKAVEKTPLGETPAGEKIYITISAGLATFPQHALNAEDLINKADEALMFGAKRGGRNQVVMYSSNIFSEISSSQ